MVAWYFQNVSDFSKSTGWLIINGLILPEKVNLLGIWKINNNKMKFVSYTNLLKSGKFASSHSMILCKSYNGNHCCGYRGCIRFDIL